MLYDNAQLAEVHLIAFERTGDPRWRAEAESTFAFVARSLTGPEGGFYSALDAESEGEEGRSNVWTEADVAKALGAEAAATFGQVYGLDRPPNFEQGRHVLLEPKPRPEVAADLGLSPEAARTEAHPTPPDAPGGARPTSAASPRRQGAHVLERPDDRGLCRRLSPPQGPRLPPCRRSGRRFPPGDAPDARRPPPPDLPRRAGQAARVPRRLCLPRPRPPPPPRRDRRPEATGPGEGSGRPDDRRLRRRRARRFLLHRDRPRVAPRPCAKDPYDGALPGGNSVAIRVLVALLRRPATPAISTTPAKPSTPSAPRSPATRRARP